MNPFLFKNSESTPATYRIQFNYVAQNLKRAANTAGPGTDVFLLIVAARTDGDGMQGSFAPSLNVSLPTSTTVAQSRATRNLLDTPFVTMIWAPHHQTVPPAFREQSR